MQNKVLEGRVGEKVSSCNKINFHAKHAKNKFFLLLSSL